MNDSDIVKDAKEDFVIIYVNDFTTDSFKDFQENFFSAERSGQTIVPIMIDSEGGDIYSLFSMIDMIRSSKLAVSTIGIGKAMSCGADLLAAGTKGYRYAAPLCSIMVHEGETATIGKPTDVKVNLKESDRVFKKTFDMLDVHCGKVVGYWSTILKEKMNADVYLTADEAKEHGIVDWVRLPRFEPEVKIKTRIM